MKKQDLYGKMLTLLHKKMEHLKTIEVLAKLVHKDMPRLIVEI
jgi:hypothetical protein